MAYADQEMSTRRVAAIAFVALLHAGVGYALVTGLAYNAAKQMYEDLKTFDVVPEEPDKPEEPPPPPPKDMPPPPPSVTVPPPMVTTNVVTTNVIRPIETVKPIEIAKPVEKPPEKPKIAVKGGPKGNPGGWVTNDDYPPSAKRNEESGTTGVRVEVGTDGKPTGCSVTSSSGSGTLDDAACRLLMRRAKFTVAKDADGNALPFSWNSRFTWRLEDN